MYIAGYMVTGFLVAGAYAFARLRGRWGRYERTALAIPLTIAALASPVQVLVGDWAAREVAERQPVKLAAIEGAAEDDARRARAHPRLVHRRRGQVRDRASPSCSRCSPSTTRTRRVQGLDAVPPDRPPAGQRRARRVPADGRDRHAAGAARRRLSRVARAATATARVALVLPRGGRRRAALGGRADRRLGDDRGRPPALGRLPA